MRNRDVLPVSGITCTNCAAKIERDIMKREEVASCQIDFATSRMVIEWIDVSERKAMLESIEQTMNRIEPGAKFIKTEEDQTEQRDTILWRFLAAAFIFSIALWMDSSQDILWRMG